MNWNDILTKVKELAGGGIWSMTKEQAGRWYWLIKPGQAILVAVEKYKNDRCKDKASALTYYTILSIVPLVAMVFGIASAFGFNEILRTFITDSFKGQEVVAQYLLDFSDKYIANMKGGWIAGIGFAMMIWTVKNLLGHTEQTFNQIWQVEKSRSLVRKLSDYITIIILALVAVVAVSSSLVNVTNQLSSDINLARVWGIVLSFVPMIMMWLGVSMIYYILPNTKVSLRAAITGGFFTTIALVIMQFIYLEFQIGLNSNNAVYGSFAAIPLFLIWLQTMWYIIILGCELVCVIQNFSSYGHNADTSRYSVSDRRKVSLQIVRYVIVRFAECKSAPSVKQIANDLKLPFSFVKNLMPMLEECGLLSKVITNADDAYQPAFDVRQMTVRIFLDRVENLGKLRLSTDGNFKWISDYLDNIFNDEKSLDILIQDIPVGNEPKE
ncbi:MAG: YihY/virulence factor BrkB family protein [Marinilabiliaceae bacterium]|nr:YihY/virulence factor BrkB family protein [Marinilabiliaceae bacterium]